VWKVSDMAKWKAAGIADWWDDQHRAAGGKLNQFIEQHPDWFGVMVATTFNTALDLTDPAFDSLRFGEGLATGGVGGIATDAVRLIGLMGPLGKLGKAAQIFSNQRLARAISIRVDPTVAGFPALWRCDKLERSVTPQSATSLKRWACRWTRLG